VPGRAGRQHAATNPTKVFHNDDVDSSRFDHLLGFEEFLPIQVFPAPFPRYEVPFDRAIIPVEQEMLAVGLLIGVTAYVLVVTATAHDGQQNPVLSVSFPVFSAVSPLAS
jgi:hypothetical protein